jgi:predicted O-methyltransferase YrrM
MQQFSGVTILVVSPDPSPEPEMPFPGGLIMSDSHIDPFAIVEEAVARLPWPEHDPVFSRALAQFVRHTGAREVLELGTGHGGSACWLATGVRLNGGGTLTTMDRDSAPSVEQLLKSAGVAEMTRVVRTPRSYTSELMQLIQANTVDYRCNPQFDFCFVDGAHNWDTDGFAFFLVEKLLRPGGWLVFDDLDWTYATTLSLAPVDAEVASFMSPEERSTPQIRDVFELLVRQHPGFDVVRQFRVHGWARKSGPQDSTDDSRLIDELEAAVDLHGSHA